MAEDWVRNHLISIEIDKDVIDNFISKGYKSKRRFLKLNEERLAKYFPDLLPADRDEILDSINSILEEDPESAKLARTLSKNERGISRDSSLDSLRKDDSMKKEDDTKEEGEEEGGIPEDKVLSAALLRADKYEDDPKVEYYDIFISYRRSRVGDARALKQALKDQGMKVFLDIDREEGLGAGMFQDQLEKVLHKVPVVIVLMTEAPSGPNDEARGGINRSVLSSMEHVSRYAHLGWTDYCRVEMAVALRMKKLVVPVYPGSMGSSYIGKELGKLNGIEDVQSLRNCNAFPLYDDMFDQSVDKIVGAIKKSIDAERPPDLALALSMSKVPKSAQVARSNGCTALQCKLYGFTAKECMLAGYQAKELYPLCIEPKQFYKEKTEVVGRNQKEISDIIPTVDIHVGYFFGRIDVPTTRFGTHKAIMCDMGNYKSEEFLVRNQDEDGSYPFGFGPDRLLKFDYTPKEIETLNLTAPRLRNMGYDARECKYLGFSAQDCRLAGFSASELYDLCVQPENMLMLKSGTELLCRNQETEKNANTEEEVGIFLSKLVDVSPPHHKISQVRDFWPNKSRLRSQNSNGFFPFGFGPDKILKFDKDRDL